MLQAERHFQPFARATFVLVHTLHRLCALQSSVRPGAGACVCACACAAPEKTATRGRAGSECHGMATLGSATSTHCYRRRRVRDNGYESERARVRVSALGDRPAHHGPFGLRRCRSGTGPPQAPRCPQITSAAVPSPRAEAAAGRSTSPTSALGTTLGSVLMCRCGSGMLCAGMLLRVRRLGILATSKASDKRKGIGTLASCGHSVDHGRCSCWVRSRSARLGSSVHLPSLCTTSDC